MSAFPPHRSQLSQPVSSDAALSILQTYLSNSAAHAYLLPNATLQATGPSAQDTSSNLTIHNLKRVEAGLRGEWLAPVLELDGTTAEENAEILDPFGEARVQEDQERVAEQAGWQDLDEYQREQSSVDGEIGPRQTAVVQNREDDLAIPIDVDTTGKVRDKEARKRAKLEREQAKKKARNESKNH